MQGTPNLLDYFMDNKDMSAQKLPELYRVGYSLKDSISVALRCRGGAPARGFPFLSFYSVRLLHGSSA